MTFMQQSDVLERLHLLIKRRGTGTPHDLAEKFEVSIGTIKNWINILKSNDLPINYCRFDNTYYYEYEVNVTFFKVECNKA